MTRCGVKDAFATRNPLAELVEARNPLAEPVEARNPTQSYNPSQYPPTPSYSKSEYLFSHEGSISHLQNR